MPKENTALLAFNRGLVSPLALARTDLKRTSLSAETMTNWMPRVLGSMSLRPGLKYLGQTDNDNASYFMEFIFSTDDTALIELTDELMRVWVSDALITRPTVTSTVANSGFDTDVASWTDNDEAGGTSAWVTGGYLGLTGNGSAYAIRTQQITVAADSQNIAHALRIVIQRGPVEFRVGSSSGGTQYIGPITLGTGTHSIVFTPTADFYIQFQSSLKRQVLVSSCSVESAGTFTIPTPWQGVDLDNIRFDQSGDILYVACDGYQQYKIERRSDNSWSVVKYEPNDGPFRSLNTTATTITPSALSGNITLTAFTPTFRSTHVGALWEIISTGQDVTVSVTAENQFSNAILVEGAGTRRRFQVIRSGTWSATVTLQRSLTSATGPWEDATTYTTNGTVTYDDTLDNQLVWYRIGVDTGDFTSGTAVLTLTYAIGTTDGIVRITEYTSTTSASAEVISDLGKTNATQDWAEGSWSDYRGYPSSVAFSEGRLWWSGRNGVFGSVSDGFESFSQTITGDSGPIIRTIGSGPVDTINWILGLQRLILGAEGAEFVCKSSSLDEPLTPTNFNIKQGSGQGSGGVEALVIDKSGVFVQRGGTRVMEIAVQDDGEYGAVDLTVLVPEITQGQVVRMAVQRQPDTRIHCVLNDGAVAISIFDKTENVLCWVRFETDGTVEDVAVLPGAVGSNEDKVYYIVNRGGNRCLERWAEEDDCQGDTLNHQADSYIQYSGASTTTITGLGHLADGESVVVWANGKNLGSYTIASSQITGLSEAVTSAIVGLSYSASYKSAKLAYASGLGTALTQKKRITHLGLILRRTHHEGVQYGNDLTTMYDLPVKENETPVADDTVHLNYDEEAVEFPGQWDTDARLCLKATAPKPAIVMAAILSVETHDKY